jgi:hypothetical protein
MGNAKNAYKILVEKSEWMSRLQDMSVHGKLREIGCKVWIGFIWLRTGTSGGSCEHGNELLRSTRGGGISVVAKRLIASEGGLFYGVSCNFIRGHKT